MCISLLRSSLSFSFFLSLMISQIVNSEAVVAQGTRRKRVDRFLFFCPGRSLAHITTIGANDNQDPPLPGFTCKSIPKHSRLARRNPSPVALRLRLRSKHAIVFQGSSRVFYPTFVMPLPAGRTSGSTYHVCNGCFTASRVGAELLMDPPVGDDTPEGRVPLIIPLRDRKSSCESEGRIFIAYLTLNAAIWFRLLSEKRERSRVYYINRIWSTILYNIKCESRINYDIN